ncbi:MAG: hypothetical protein L6Q54_13310 [Leptospiraceae bacterium]|nr:hypothetical protein [Leptospiraceae bacterium]MCK6382213.1 hypothetical protein [Leptospiraceae bacterium]NUM42014.1 hypothetical protein [Leptospiraceae bacterium]
MKVLEIQKKSEDFVIEIKDSSINVEDIMRELESSLSKRNVSKDEIERISGFRFSPKSLAGFREFDPSFTANLFEKGISVPKFTNPSLWFIKGPLKWIVVKLVEVYSFVDKKLSENRIRAFYNVLHELILLRSKHEALMQRYEKFYKDFLELQALINEKVQPDFEISVVRYQNSKHIDESDEMILKELSSNTKKTLILFPEWGDFLLKLRAEKISFESVSFSKHQFEYIKKEITDNVQFSEDLVSIDFSEFDSIVFQCNANLIPNWKIELLLKTILEKSKKNTKVFLRFSEKEISCNSPFQPSHPTKIVFSEVRPYLKNLGYKEIVEYEKKEDGFYLFSFYTD